MRLVFAGPSLRDAQSILPNWVTVLPPAKCGDLHAAVQQGFTHIGLIDGTFETGMSVWHKEIIYALDKGIKIAGSSSMGALRAAECAAFGMQGFGAIFQSYHNGDRTCDADVALLFAPEELNFQPLSITMVDLEATVAKLKRLNLLDAVSCHSVLDAARRIFYKTRTVPDVLAVAFGRDDQDLRKMFAEHWTDQKRQDALLLVDWITSS